MAFNYYDEIKYLNDRLNSLENKIDRIDNDFEYFYKRMYPNAIDSLVSQNNELRKAIRPLYYAILGLIILNFYFMIR